MQEHELNEYQRLRAEGQWFAASEFREAERQRLRAAGRNRQQARDESWKAMLEKYPARDGQTPAHESAVALGRWSEADAADSESQLDEHNQDAEIAEELKQLAGLTNGQPADVDRDIDFAYRKMALETVTPLTAPSLAAWQWYLYSRREPNKFLEIFAKREDAKAKQAGTITNQRMEDDKRQQFAVIDRIIEQLQEDVKAIAKDLMEKCSEDLLHACRKHEEPWKAYFEKYPL
jgi:poly-D-alanine transfer protein DltD